MRSTSKLLMFLLLMPLPAWATLGQYEGSVAADQEVLHGELRAQARAGYTVHQIITPDGAVVREYVSPDGQVFGISWHSRTLPNLSQLLGSYMTRVQQASQTHATRGPLAINATDFVYFSGGRMMNFYGSAYVPGLLPKGVAAEVVR